MSKGSWAATASSSIIVAADANREFLFIQKITNAVAVAIGIGEAAEAGKGIQLTNIGDSVLLRGPNARAAIYAIGNTGAGTYQDGGEVTYVPGPTPAAG
jgi:hypothetical protein